MKLTSLCLSKNSTVLKRNFHSAYNALFLTQGLPIPNFFFSKLSLRLSDRHNFSFSQVNLCFKRDLQLELNEVSSIYRYRGSEEPGLFLLFL